jgi:RNA polymerase sigma-70 factor (ECF subfamily)
VDSTREPQGTPVRALPTSEPPAPSRTPTASSLYEAHGEFVWKSLYRLGVAERDLEDMVQEVFVVVHRRLDSFDGSSKATTWLFGISMRVASTYRRSAYHRREIAVDPTDRDDRVDEAASPEETASLAQARARLDAVLDRMDLEKRAVFVMFEIEQMPCAEIATLLDVPVGTVYSRLHAARKSFEAELARIERVADGKASR